MSIAGHLVKYDKGAPAGAWDEYLQERVSHVGKRGTGYDYIMAGNGLWIRAENAYLRAEIPIGPVEVRGLADEQLEVVLRHGPIPAHLFELALDVMLGQSNKETYVAVVWKDGAYGLAVPGQLQGGASVSYEPPADRVLEMHSHGAMGAFFSGVDTRDEQGLAIYGVVGYLKTTPRARFRVGVYGYFWELETLSQVFDGPISVEAEVGPASIPNLAQELEAEEQQAERDREGEEDLGERLRRALENL